MRTHIFIGVAIVALVIVVLVCGCRPSYSKVRDSKTIYWHSPNYPSRIVVDNSKLFDQQSLDSNVILTLKKGEDVFVNGLRSLNGLQPKWIEVSTEETKEPQGARTGWVHLEDIEMPTGLRPSEIFLGDDNSIHRRSILGEEILSDSSKLNTGGKFRWFVWTGDYDNSKYIFTDSPGLYIFDSERRDPIQLISSLDTGWSQWQNHTYDAKYWVLDLGSTPSPREIDVYRMDTAERVFQGKYFQDIQISGHSISIVVDYKTYISDFIPKDADVEVVLSGAKKVYDQLVKPNNDVLIEFRLNIDNMEKKFLRYIAYFHE